MSISHRKNSILGFISFGIPTLVILGAYPVLINFLGVDAMGAYLLATSLSGAWAVLDFGMFAATLKYVSEDVEKNDLLSASDIIKTSIVFYVVIGLVFAVTIILTSGYLVKVLSIETGLQDDATVAFNIAGVRFSLFFLNMVFISVFKSLHRFDYSTMILTGLSVVTFGGAAIGASQYGLGLVGVSIIALTGNLLGIVVSAVLCVRLLRSENIYLSQGKPNLGSFKRMFSYGMYLAINGIATSALVLVQKFLVSIFLGPAAVTIFTVAGTVITKAQAAVIAGFEFLVPWASKVTSGKSKEEYRKLKLLYIKSTVAAIALLFAGAVFLLFNGELLLKWWLRSEIYREVSEVLNILLIGLIGWSMVPTGYHLVNGIGKPVINTIFLIVNVSLLYITLAILLLDGATIADFAVSQSVAMVGQGTLFISYFLLVVWKRWLK